jgi:HK97 family phage major capsid protein
MGKARVETAPVTVADRDHAIALLFPYVAPQMATVDAGPLVPTDQRLFPPVPSPVRQLRVRDLVNVTTTDSDTVTFAKETTRTDVAAETPYGTDSPEATYVYDQFPASVKRLTHFTPATKGNLADQGQLRGLIDGRLIYGVGKRADGQMVNGDGAGDNLEGILATATIGSYDHTTDGVAGDKVPDALHKALTVVRIALEDEPTAFLLHPTDYEGYALAKGDDGHYLTLQGPQLTTPANVWGKPAVINTVVGAGTAIVGEWQQGATLWVRSGVEVAASDSHADFFRKGLVALLAELRAAFAVVQPLAFCEITGLGVDPT